MQRYRACVYPPLQAITVMLLAALALGAWQFQFVYDGTMSNLYINGAIYICGVIGIALQYKNLFELRGEFLTLEVLEEAYQDTRRAHGEHAQSDAAAALRRQRLDKPAIVLHEPNLLGGSFKLLYSQLKRQGDLKVPSSTARVLIEDLENRFSDRTAFLNYFANLCVLLGLLGTFIGLLQTVASVGSIISGLDLSGGAGPEAIQNLLNGLEAPLNGMATGFSSSLFGLIGSLLIGAMGKAAGRAEGALKDDFEAWLKRVAEIERIDGEGAPGSAGPLAAAMPGSATDAAGLRVMLRVARSTLLGTAQTGKRIEALCGGIDALRAESAEQRLAQIALSERLDRSLELQAQLLEVIRDGLRQNRAPVERLGESIERLEARITAENRATREVTVDMTRLIAQLSSETAVRFGEASDRVGRELAEIGRDVERALEAVRLRIGETRAVDRAGAEAEALAATIDHMMRDLRLAPEEVRRLRRLAASASAETADAAPSGDDGRFSGPERRRPDSPMRHGPRRGAERARAERRAQAATEAEVSWVEALGDDAGTSGAEAALAETVTPLRASSSREGAL